MKFTKEEVIKKIASGLGKNQKALSERTISETVEQMMLFATEETELDNFCELIMPTFKSMAGNISKEVSERVKNPKVDEKNEEPVDFKSAIAEAIKEYSDKANKEISDLKESLRIEKEANEKKASIEKSTADIIEKYSKKYPKHIIAIARKGFDFSNEKADELFDAECVASCDIIGVKIPESGKFEEGSAKEPDWAKEADAVGLKKK